MTPKQPDLDEPIKLLLNLLGVKPTPEDIPLVKSWLKAHYTPKAKIREGLIDELEDGFTEEETIHPDPHLIINSRIRNQLRAELRQSLLWVAETSTPAHSNT